MAHQKQLKTSFSSGMRGNEKEHTYHENQNPEAPKDNPVGDQAGAEVAGVNETPSVFSSGMRGTEKYDPSQSAGNNELEAEVDNEKPDEAMKGLPAGSEVIGTTKTHHIVKVPVGKGTSKAVPQ